MKKKLRRVNLETKETTTVQAIDPFLDTDSSDVKTLFIQVSFIYIYYIYMQMGFFILFGCERGVGRCSRVV